MRRVFNSDKLQQEYERDGFVKVTLLDEATINHLLVQAKQYAGSRPGFDALIYMEKDPKLKQEVFNIIWDSVSGAVSTIFSTHKPLIATFLIKNSGDEGEVAPHQDWTVVDESQYRSFIVWCPLIATTNNNGALCLVPGSHRLNNNPRVMPDIRYHYRQPNTLQLIKKHAKIVPTNLGEAIIFDNKTIHFSNANHTITQRIAIGVQMVPQEAPTYYHCENREGKTGLLDICEIDKEVIINLSVDEIPVKTKVIGQTGVKPQPDPYLELKNILAPSLYSKLKRSLGFKTLNQN